VVRKNCHGSVSPSSEPRVGEAVGDAGGARAQEHAHQAQPHHDDLPPRRRQEDGPDDPEQQRRVDQALRAHRDPLRLVEGDVLGLLLGVGAPVDHEEHRQQVPHGPEPEGPQAQRPGERDTPQVAEEERRIAHRREQPAAVRDQQDEEEGDVRDVLALPVGAQDRPDQQHARAGGADQVREHRPDGQDRQVGLRRGPEVAADVDAAGDDVERPEQRDERDVLVAAVQQALGELEEQVDPHRRRDDGREDPAVPVALPPVVGHERQDRDPEQHHREGDHRPERDLGAELRHKPPWAATTSAGPAQGSPSGQPTR